MADSLGLELRVPVHSQLWESVLSSLRLAIVKGSLAPGTHLVEADLAALLNVSRGPVREALTRLEHEGLIVNYPYRGKFVADISPEDVHEVYDLRRMLEGRALELLVGHLDDEQLALLRRLSEQMAEALNDGQVETFADLDVEFHQMLVAMSHRERLLQIWNTLSGLTHAFIVINTRKDPVAIGKIADGHKQLVDALARPDLAEALTILNGHLSEAEDNMLRTKTTGAASI
jgi:DNA-binding GntR family transcriptional regulator